MRGLNARWINRSSLRQHVGPTGDAKRSFNTRDDAAVFAERQSSPALPYRAYRCRFCKLWHIGRDRSASTGAA